MILVLGGTTEGRALADLLAAAVYSLAGRVLDPLLPSCEVRIGGFGGVPGLTSWLQDRRPVAVVDATHPFAAQMSAHAVASCAELGIPLLRLQRPGWEPVAGDRWIRVPTMQAAAEALPQWGSRVLLTTGRQDLAAFADLDLHFVARSVEAPTGRLPAPLVTILGRPPWSLDVERLLLREHAIDVLVTKNSGGPTAPKLTAARELGIPVVMVDRPAVLAAEQVSSVEQVLAWLGAVSRRG